MPQNISGFLTFSKDPDPMTLYHGSYTSVPLPRILPAGSMVDFGTGFYTTTDRGQAAGFTRRFVKLGRSRIVNIYEYDEISASGALSIFKYPAADAGWLRYVVANRMGRGADGDFDIVAGPVADDFVYSVIDNFELGIYTEEEAIKRFLTYRLTDQVVFKTGRALGYLKYIGSEGVKE
jgi:hypothetical protein